MTQLERFSKLGAIGDITPEEKQEMMKEIPIDVHDPAMKERIFDKLVETVRDNIEFKKERISFYKMEIDFLRSIAQASNDDIVIRAFVCLFVIRKIHFHKSGWIRYNIDEINKINGAFDFNTADIHKLFEYGFDMRVSGSKMAMATFLDPDILVYGVSLPDYDDTVVLDVAVGDSVNVVEGLMHE